MAETKHTPGPWAISEHAELACLYVDVPGMTNMGGVATLYSGCVDRAQLDANARLIAAAPDMLEALLSVAPHVHRKFCLPDLCDDDCVRIRAAIAKATCRHFPEEVASDGLEVDRG